MNNIIIYILTYILSIQLTHNHNTIIEKYHNLFKGNLLKIELGTPSQFIFSQIYLKYNFSFTTPYTFKRHNSSTYSPEEGTKTIILDKKDKTIKIFKETITLVENKISIPNYSLYYLENNTDISHEGLSLGRLFENESFSLIHQLYLNKYINKKGFGFSEEEKESGKGVIYFGELPQEEQIKKIKGKIYVKDINDNTWNTEVSKVLINKGKNGTIEYIPSFNQSYFDVNENTIYVPETFMFYLNETIFKQLIRNNLCTFSDRYNTKQYHFECSCNVLDTFPEITFVINNIGLTMKNYDLFEEAFGYCYFLIESNSQEFGDLWIFQTPLINKLTTFFDYDDNSITFYSHNRVTLFNISYSYTDYIKIILITNILILGIILFDLLVIKYYLIKK